ncbi:MAG: GTPase ObgE [Bdellovibrionales bacterium]
MKFVDEVTIEVISGKGGEGAVSFRREAMVPRGGPDGGDGGRGGDVVVEADARLHSLLDLRFQKTYRAKDGEIGRGQNKSGKDAEDLVLKVPPGTLIRNEDGEILHDLGGESRVVLLKGGLGGKGNTFYKSSVNQAPMVSQKGLPGQQMTVRLELKLLADVGIIGLPNAGKSTLISRMSSAKPKIADYPFTTLVPNLGVVRFGDDLSYVVADIPGLIEGASEGVGLGIQFLRHVERCRLLVHLIDVSPMLGKDPVEAYEEIRQELKKYDEIKASDSGYEPLSARPEWVVLNKIDSCEEMTLKEYENVFKKRGCQVMSISAATGKNIKPLIEELGRKVFGQ